MIIEVFKSEVKRYFPGFNTWEELTYRQKKIIVLEVLRHRTDAASQKIIFLVEANIPSAQTFAFSDDGVKPATSG